MRAKKTLFLTALTLMLLVGLVTAGTGLAAPAGLDVHSPTHVAGTFVHDWEAYSEGELSLYPDWINPTSWSVPVHMEFDLAGDLQGRIVEDVIISGAVPWLGPNTTEGMGTFVGTLRGVKTSFKYTLANAWGYDPTAPGAPDTTLFIQSADLVITSSASPVSHLRGTLHLYAHYVNDVGSSTYSGDLTWQTGKKN
jgi:hypothetical protein